MACPIESHTLAEFGADSPKYENREASGVRQKLSDIGVKIYRAVRLESGKDKSSDYKSKVELEKLLGQSVNGGKFVDSAWGCDTHWSCSCDPECRCDRDCGCDHHKACMHCKCVSLNCSCHNDCSSYCRYDNPNLCSPENQRG